jgi:hypothetical protein
MCIGDLDDGQGLNPSLENPSFQGGRLRLVANSLVKTEWGFNDRWSSMNLEATTVDIQSSHARNS